MKIENTSSALINLQNVPKISSRSTQAAEARKTLGETPPVKVPMDQLGSLAGLFARAGFVTRLARKLNRLKHKKCRVTPAKGTIACVDSDDLVYLGVDFLRAYQDREDVVAGVMAHEWGHACADRPDPDEVDQMNWNDIFALRREHETLADDISGRLLALLGYSPDGLIAFLTNGKDTHNLKYHSKKTRSEIIRQAYEDETRKIALAKEMFRSSLYANDHTSRLIDEDV